MKNKNNQEIKLKPKAVKIITISFLIIATVLASILLIQNGNLREKAIAENSERNIKSQIIEKNMEIGEAEEGTLTENGGNTALEGVMTVRNIAGVNDTLGGAETNIDTSEWDTEKVNIVYDPTGIPVPVPKGFTASSVESEKYVNGLNVEKKGIKTDLTLSSSGEYPWTQNADDGIWSSGNYHVASSTSELVSNEITVGENGGYLSVEWSVSSQSGNDLLSITITNTETGTSETPTNISNTVYGSSYSALTYTKYNKELEPGKYTISFQYTKNASTDTGLDTGYVKSASILNYDNEGTDTVTVHQYGGFVIYEGNGEVTESNAWDESKSRNQFVWIPVEDTSRIYETNSTTGKKKAKLWSFIATGRTAISNTDTDTRREPGALSGQSYDNIRYLSSQGLQGYTKATFYKELEIEFDNAMESIEKYGGFYIGRYETGNISSATPVVRRLNTTISNQTWYRMYNRMKNISNNENIQTSMIWGCLWDETLQWLIETGEKTQAEIALDSTSWGNYTNISFTYTNTSGTTATKATGGTRIPTGSTERNKANNIYDMAGNVYDWTLEGDGSYYCRFSRGGSYVNHGAGYPAHYRSPYSYPNGSGVNIRFPCVLLHQIGRRYVDKATYLPDPLNADGDTL